MATEVPGLTIVVGQPAHDTTLTESQLDPGIADVVIMLRNLGFNPTDSGDGVSKPDAERDFDVKHVACTFDPMNSDPSLAGPARFFEEADRLQKVLGRGWKVEASYAPADESYILLATKNDPPGPRHAGVLSDWPFEAAKWHQDSALTDTARIRMHELYRKGCALQKALQLELGRR